MTTDDPSGATGSVVIRRRDLAGPVLNRVLATAAAQAELPLDRVGDVLLLGDEIGGGGRWRRDVSGSRKARRCV
jgi:hypothetical protein